MNAEDFLKNLKQSSSPKVSKTLDAIYQICLEQEKRKIYDFSAATIARLGYNRGVPKAQSINNKTGQVYRELLSFFSSQYTEKKSVIYPKGDDDWIEEINSPKLKLLVRMQAAELAAAKKKLAEFIPPSARIAVSDYQNVILDEDAKFTNLERRALEYIVSDDFLNKWGFSISEYGEIVDASGTVVLRAATSDAVRKALNFL